MCEVKDCQSEKFFQLNRQPSDLNESTEQLKEFVAKHMTAKRRIALVTSGGTIVPLENRTVRYIDNFSIGSRGAISAEYFLLNDYAVIFLHRRGSLEPFQRHLQNTNVLDILQIKDKQVVVGADHEKELLEVLTTYKDVSSRGALLSIPFTTLSDYLHTLQCAALALQPYAQSALLYLAAAVSDFYIPSTDLLETDISLLIKKARKSLNNYHHQVVIGNILETRKSEVVLVTPADESWIRLTDEQLHSCEKIEEYIVKNLVERHTRHLKTNS